MHRLDISVGCIALGFREGLDVFSHPAERQAGGGEEPFVGLLPIPMIFGKPPRRPSAQPATECDGRCEAGLSS